jgi:hypothetical protein
MMLVSYRSLRVIYHSAWSLCGGQIDLNRPPSADASSLELRNGIHWSRLREELWASHRSLESRVSLSGNMVFRGGVEMAGKAILRPRV